MTWYPSLADLRTMPVRTLLRPCSQSLMTPRPIPTQHPEEHHAEAH